MSSDLFQCICLPHMYVSRLSTKYQMTFQPHYTAGMTHTKKKNSFDIIIHTYIMHRKRTIITRIGIVEVVNSVYLYHTYCNVSGALLEMTSSLDVGSKTRTIPSPPHVHSLLPSENKTTLNRGSLSGSNHC